MRNRPDALQRRATAAFYGAVMMLLLLLIFFHAYAGFAASSALTLGAMLGFFLAAIGLWRAPPM